MQVLGDEQKRAEAEKDAEGVSRQRRAEFRHTEQAQVDQRVRQGALPLHKEDANHQTGQHRPHSQRAQAVFRHLLKTINHQQHGGQ